MVHQQAPCHSICNHRLGAHRSSQIRISAVIFADDTFDGTIPAPVDMVNNLIISRVSYMSGGAGFLQSAVSFQDWYFPELIVKQSDPLL